MKLLNCASALTAVALLAVPPIIGVEAAETAKAMLKDAKGQDVGSVSFIQTPAGVLLQLSLNSVPAGEHAFHVHAVGKCESPSFDGRRAFQSGQRAPRDDVGPWTRWRYAEPARSGKRRPRSRSAQRLDHPRQG
jgi:Cu/Zn superoxide dismutase